MDALMKIQLEACIHYANMYREKQQTIKQEEERKKTELSLYLDELVDEVVLALKTYKENE